MIAVLGVGKMGEALVSGLLRAGCPPATVIAAVRRVDRAEALREAYGIEVLGAAAAARRAGTLLITVKPQDMAALLDEIGPEVTVDKLVISVAAGITTAFIGRKLKGDVPVVRVMSNTPVLSTGDERSRRAHAGEGASSAEELLRLVGKSCGSPSHSRMRRQRYPAAGRPCLLPGGGDGDAGILLGMRAVMP
jgi:pyrroline-5-carboxylate reductase